MIIIIPAPGSRSPLDGGLQFVGGDVPPLGHPVTSKETPAAKDPPMTLDDLNFLEVAHLFNALRDIFEDTSPDGAGENL